MTSSLTDLDSALSAEGEQKAKFLYRRCHFHFFNQS